MPNAFDPPSGFLATANSRVTTDKSPYPLTDDWADPYRIERIYKSLDGRDQLTPADMLAVQTDIYSEVDQEMGHRFAYAIDHTPGPEGNGDPAHAPGRRPDAQLGRPPHHRFRRRFHRHPDPRRAMAHDSRAQTRQSLHPTITGASRNFALEEIVMHAKPEWLPKELQKLGRAAHRGRAQRHALTAKRPAISRSGPTEAGTWSTSSTRSPHFLPFISRMAGTGPQPQSGDGDHCEAGRPDARPIAALHHGLEQHRRLNREHRARRKRQPAQPVLPRPVERLVQRNHLRAALYSGSGRGPNPAHVAACCHERTGNRETSGKSREQAPASVPRRPALLTPGPLSSSSPHSSPSFRSSFAATPAATTSTSTSSPGSTASTRGVTAFVYPHWAPSPNYGAGEPRFVFYPPLTWMLGAALASFLPWDLAPIALTFLILRRHRPRHARPRSRSARRLALHPRRLRLAIFSGFALFTGTSAPPSLNSPAASGSRYRSLRDALSQFRAASGGAPGPSHLGTGERCPINYRTPHDPSCAAPSTAPPSP